MNKFFILFLFLITAFLKAQDYKISEKGLAKVSEKPKYQFSMSYPQIKGFKSNVTAMRNFNEHIENIVLAQSDTFTVWMADWDTTTTDHEMGSYYQAGDSVFYMSNELISVQFYEGYYFSGAAHPNNSSFTVNYDLENFKELTLNDLLKSGWESKISEISIREIEKQKKQMGIEPVEWVKDGAGPKAENFKVFNVTRKGLVITFPTYQVGSYVEGPSEVFISFGKIKSIIREDGILDNF